MANKMTIDFDGFDEMIAQLDDLGGNLKEVTEAALIATHEYVTPQIKAAFAKHNIKYSHETAKSIIDSPNIEWQGMLASVDVGFKISNGGLASIFVMYGTPKMAPDRKLYNAIYGSKTKKEVAEIQRNIIAEAIEKAMG